MSYSNPSRRFQDGWQRSYWSRRDTRGKKKKTGGGTGNWHDDAMGLQ
jgi:hypothetical protein